MPRLFFALLLLFTTPALAGEQAPGAFVAWIWSEPLKSLQK